MGAALHTSALATIILGAALRSAALVAAALATVVLAIVILGALRRGNDKLCDSSTICGMDGKGMFAGGQMGGIPQVAQRFFTSARGRQLKGTDGY